MASPCIRIENLSKSFYVEQHRPRTVKDALIRAFSGSREGHMFEALRDISFEVAAGETVGIVGTNGSGKSTLFKLISGIIRPTSGHIHARGRIAPLIELSAGFHPDLSGRENVFLNASVYGLKRGEIAARLPAIIEFAEIGDFFDAPLRVFSSGMMARLAFSVAVHVDADILLVDEVLATGDVAFQERCYRRIEELRKNGITIVHVSHSLAEIRRISDRALWLNKGRLEADGDTASVLERYRAHTMGQRAEPVST